MIAGWFDPTLAKKVRILALEREVSLQALLGEALADVLKKYEKQGVTKK